MQTDLKQNDIIVFARTGSVMDSRLFWVVVQIECLGPRNVLDSTFYTLERDFGLFGVSRMKYQATLLSENGKILVISDFEPLSWTKVEL